MSSGLRVPNFEPGAFKLETRDWADLVKEDPLNVLVRYRPWSQTIYRFYVATYGQMPRYAEFVKDIEAVGRGVTINFFDEESELKAKLGEFARDWVERPKFASKYKRLTDERFVDELYTNAGITSESSERANFIDRLNHRAMTRAEVLLAIVNKPDFVEREANRSLVLLHYFGYLHRNPEDPPDKSLDGFNFWLKEMEASPNPRKLASAFMESDEYKSGTLKK